MNHDPHDWLVVYLAIPVAIAAAFGIAAFVGHLLKRFWR